MINNLKFTMTEKLLYIGEIIPCLNHNKKPRYKHHIQLGFHLLDMSVLESLCELEGLVLLEEYQ